MVNDEIDHMLTEMENQFRYQGMDMNLFLQYSGKTMEGFREELKPEAEKNVANRIILTSMAKQEGITATDEDVEKGLEEFAKPYNMEVEKAKELMGESGLKYFKKDMVIKKAIAFIYDNAKF